MTDALPSLPPASDLIRAAIALHDGGDIATVEAILAPRMSTAAGAAVLLVATFDLSCRIAAFSGQVLAVYVGTGEGPELERHPIAAAPVHVRIAATVANHVIAQDTGDALRCYLEEAERTGGGEWPIRAQVLALEALAWAIGFDSEAPGVLHVRA